MKSKLYKAYVRERIRVVLAEADIPLWRAIEFLNECSNGVIISSDGVEHTKEELQNVKDFGSKSGTKSYSPAPSDGALFEDTDSELSGSSEDNPE